MSAELIQASRAVVVHQAPRLTSVQRRAILALVECPSLSEAAETVGKSPRTLTRWLLLPHFRACFERLCEAREMALSAKFQQESESALEVLSGIANHKYNDLAQRVHASRHILEYADRRHARSQASQNRPDS